MNEDDVRIEYYRTGSVNWTGHGSATHLPTGILVEFNVSWDDKREMNRAIAQLREMVRAHGDGEQGK